MRGASDRYTGGCQCGSIRYELKGQPLTVYVCHCQECQKQSASAFGISMSVPKEAVVILPGTPKQWHRIADSGNEVVCLFCDNCGTRLFHYPTRNLRIANIKAGSLDDTSWFEPVGNLWTQSAQKWVALRDDMLNYATQPPDFGELVRRWHEKNQIS